MELTELKKELLDKTFKLYEIKNYKSLFINKHIIKYEHKTSVFIFNYNIPII